MLQPWTFSPFSRGAKSQRAAFYRCPSSSRNDRENPSPQRDQARPLKVGERLERAYSERAQEVALELAIHFEHGREYGRAIQYLGKAADLAATRGLVGETAQLLARAELYKYRRIASGRNPHVKGQSPHAPHGFIMPHGEKFHAF